MAAYTDIISIVGGACQQQLCHRREPIRFAESAVDGDGWLAKTESERTIAIINACSG